MLSVGDAADRLQVSSGTVRNWITKGYIGAVRLPSGHRKLPESEISRLLTRMFEPPTQLEEESTEPTPRSERENPALGRLNYANAFMEQDMQEIVQRIIEVADPVRVVLFGSAARGEMGPDSDADFLVVVKAPAHRRDIATNIRAALRDVRFPLDIVVVTTEDIEHFGDSPAAVIRPALDEGRVLYVA